MITKEEAYKKIQELVTRFGEQIDSYKQADYNETLTRRDFIDPFFKALGWDVDNSQGYAEAYREVIHEDRVKVGKATKAPDYSFRLPGGKRLFFVEAKKPSVTIKDDISVAYQIRRYGWSAKLPISIITDFEEFAVYDCTKKPNPTDKTGVARIKYINFKDYLNEFEYLWDTFSKERVLKGSFDKYIQSDTVKKGTATVDKEFLSSLDNWRTYLATTISLRNKELDEDEINFAVQLTIDRLIFLRIAEDRGVEQYGQLKNSINQKGDSYQNLFYNFKKADEKYNSGLFDFSKDVISEKLQVDNKVIKTIVNEMYYPESPYEFSVISVEILGSAYEQFLGKVIRITPSHHAKIEEKPEVRKAGGVYYTPQYVVDIIVKNTVGKLIEGKNPKQIEKIKIADPACGSGSFLIGAYQYLLDYHKNYYTENGTKTGKKDSPTTPEGNLTTAEKKKILLNNIYGVDIDVNAVEVTKLSLLLKCMEGETETSIAQQQKLWHERILPTLDDNIKSGNSIIDTDFYLSQLDFGDEKKIKPFNWQKGFLEVFKQGGFDAVIGNPPYLGGREWKEENGNAYEYFISKYKVAEYQFDIYAIFWEAGIKLAKDSGYVGFITPNTWLNNQSNKKLRTYILDNTTINQIVDYSKIKVFDQATVLPIVTVLEKSKNKKSATEIFEPNNGDLVLINTTAQEIWKDNDLNIININLSTSDLALRSKIETNTQSLESWASIKFGIKVYQTGKGRPKQLPEAAKNKIFEAREQLSKEYLPYLKGKDINRYTYSWDGDWLHYGQHLAEPRTIDLFKGERLLVRRIVGETLIAAYIDSDLVTGQLLQIVKPFESGISKYLLGILNSKLMAFYFRKKYNRQDKTFPEIRIYELCSLPIKNINDSNRKIQTEISKFVDELLRLKEEEKNLKLQTKLSQLQSKIEVFENKINELVYQLYELTEDEVKIIVN